MIVRYIYIQRERDIYIWIDRYMQIDGYIDNRCRQIGRWIDIYYRQIDIQIDRQIKRSTYTHVLVYRQINRYIDRQIDKEIDIYTCTCIQTDQQISEFKEVDKKRKKDKQYGE